MRLIHGYSRTVGKHSGVRGGDCLLTGTGQYGALYVVLAPFSSTLANKEDIGRRVQLLTSIARLDS